MDYENLHAKYKAEKLHGRYVTAADITPLLLHHNSNKQLREIGRSVLGKPIYSFELGSGKTKILLWSQMHGNESTTTKALMDLLNFLNGNTQMAKELLSHFTILAIPMLNPDGAQAYTRENANGVDLNRDAVQLTQPESRILKHTYDTFNPDLCFNLHDQRTIFAVANTRLPATISFLAASYNESRDVNEIRRKAMAVIVAMNTVLQQYIPGQVGRFDDSFNINCIGDRLHSLGMPTILVEAGHFQNDYNREISRKYVFIALLSALKAIYENVIVDIESDDYMNIPQNNPCLFDFVYKNIKINYDNSEIITNFAAQYKEELINNKIFFNAFIVKIGDLEQNHGHVEYDANGALYADSQDGIPRLNKKADFSLGKNVKVVNGLIKF